MVNLIIEPSEETLRGMNERFTPVADDRYLYSLQQNDWDTEKVHTFIAKLRISIDYTRKEYERIQKLKETYNLKYPSDHKMYFSTAVELLSKMRSTLSAYKKIVYEFRKKRKRGSKQKKDVPVYDQSTLFSGPYSQDCFGWDAYKDKSAKEMLDELNGYLKLASDCLDACVKIVDDEIAMRSNPELTYLIYKDSFDRSIKGNKALIELLKNTKEPIDNDIVKAMEEAEDVKQLIASLFHQLNSSEFNYYCACKTISDGRKAGLTDEEAMLFGKDNVATVIRVRTLCGHILELVEQREDAIGWKGMLSGRFVMHILYWCGWDGSKNEALLNYITKKCEGKIGLVKMGAVMAEKRKTIFNDNEVSRNQQLDFNGMIDAFVDSFLDKPSDSTN